MIGFEKTDNFITLSSGYTYLKTLMLANTFVMEIDKLKTKI